MTEQDTKPANMRIWEEVWRTDPQYTKSVPGRGGHRFTAIGAYYKILKATRTFGPVGVGWGWSVEYERVQAGEDVLVVATVDLWYMDDAHGPQRGVVPGVCGSAHLVQKTKQGYLRVDDDAWKKALMDGITKALSYLGFSGDVFLGKFDDSKYVARMRDHFREGQRRPDKPRQDTKPANPDRAPAPGRRPVLGDARG